MTRFFRDCHTAEDLKAEYRKLSKELHPDNQKTGNAESFKAMQQEYERLWNLLKDVHCSDDGKTYQSENKTTETAAEFFEIIEKLQSIPEIEIELCGRWIWINGNTYQVREQLKQAGCRYASKKKMWYWRKDEDGQQKKHCSVSMEQIREKYGSQLFGGRPAPCLE